MARLAVPSLRLRPRLAGSLSGLMILVLMVGPSAAVYKGWVDFYAAGVLTLMGINIILASSLNLVTGITGQFSLGHAGFMAVGAYTSALISIHLAWPFPVALFLGAAAACVFGIIIGLPTLRLYGDYLAIATLGFGEIIRVLILNLPITGGPRGLPGIPPKTTFFWVEALTVFTLFVIYNIKMSSHGRALVSIREDEIASEAIGVDVTRYKVIAFATAAGFAGLAGGLFAHFQMFIDPKSFSFMKSVEVLVMVVLGGMGSITGSAAAAAVLTVLPEVLRGATQYRMVAYSVLLIVLMLVRPQGLLGTREISGMLRHGRARRAASKAVGTGSFGGGDGLDDDLVG